MSGPERRRLGLRHHPLATTALRGRPAVMVLLLAASGFGGHLAQRSALDQPRGVEQHAAGPAEDVVVAHHLAHAPHALALLVERHGQRLEEGLARARSDRTG